MTEMQNEISLRIDERVYVKTMERICAQAHDALKMIKNMDSGMSLTADAEKFYECQIIAGHALDQSEKAINNMVDNAIQETKTYD